MEGVIALLRGSGIVVKSKSLSCIPAYILLGCDWGVTGRASEETSAVMLEVWVLDLGFAEVGSELTVGVVEFDWERR